MHTKILIQLGLRATPGEAHWIFLHWVQHLSAPRWHQRVRAARVLATHPIEPLAVPMVIRHTLPLLGDPSPWVRTVALDLLGRFGEMRLLPHLLRSLLDEHWAVRSAAVQAVGNLDLSRLPPVVPTCLQKLLIGDPDTTVRIAVLHALEQLGLVPQMLPLVFQQVHEEQDATLRSHAILVLAHHEDPQITQALFALCEDPEELVRDVAQRVLKEKNSTEKENREP